MNAYNITQVWSLRFIADIFGYFHIFSSTWQPCRPRQLALTIFKF